MELNNTNSGANYNIEKAVFYQNQPNYFNNGGFITAFTAALYEVATNDKLNKLDVKLLTLILSYMGDKNMMKQSNQQTLMKFEVYASELNSTKGHVADSFRKLEEIGYIKRDKRNRGIDILINPAIAYNGKTEEFTKVWNQLDMFGNEPRKEKQKKTEDEKQDWNSDLPNQLKAKNTAFGG